LIDWNRLASRWLELCPNVPIQIETISGFNRGFSYKKPEFWAHYDRRDAALTEFEVFASKGHAIESWKAPAGIDKKQAEQAYQKGELERSIAYLRKSIGLGLRSS
jgi:hypothetical protein